MKLFVKIFAELNLGDDLFLRILLERYPNVTFVLSARKEYRDIFKDYNNLLILEETPKSKTLLWKAYKVLERNIVPNLYKKSLKQNTGKFFPNETKECDGFISIGGSIFMQPKKLPAYADVEYYKTVCKYFDKIFFIGCNFGPFSDLGYKESYVKIFKEASDVCFREKASWELFAELKNVRYSTDIVFGLDYPKVEKKRKSVGFSIVSARNNIDKKSYLEKYVELVRFYQNKNHDIYFFSFCKKHGDEETINEIVKQLKSKKNIKKIFYNGDIKGFLNIYSSIEKMFCGRFHAMILSMIFNQKVYPVIYSKKMTNVLSDINYQGEVINIEDFHKIDLQFVYDQIMLNQYHVKEQIKNSIDQFRELDLFIKKNNQGFIK